MMSMAESAEIYCATIEDQNAWVIMGSFARENGMQQLRDGSFNIGEAAVRYHNMFSPGSTPVIYVISHDRETTRSVARDIAAYAKVETSEVFIIEPKEPTADERRKFA